MGFFDGASESEQPIKGVAEISRLGGTNARLCTRMVKKIDPRLREIATAARGSQDAGSRNLGPAFLPSGIIPVVRD